MPCSDKKIYMEAKVQFVLDPTETIQHGDIEEEIKYKVSKSQQIMPYPDPEPCLATTSLIFRGERNHIRPVAEFLRSLLA